MLLSSRSSNPKGSSTVTVTARLSTPSSIVVAAVVVVVAVGVCVGGDAVVVGPGVVEPVCVVNV